MRHGHGIASHIRTTKLGWRSSGCHPRWHSSFSHPARLVRFRVSMIQAGPTSLTGSRPSCLSFIAILSGIASPFMPGTRGRSVRCGVPLPPGEGSLVGRECMRGVGSTCVGSTLSAEAEAGGKRLPRLLISRAGARASRRVLYDGDKSRDSRSASRVHDDPGGKAQHVTRVATLRCAQFRWRSHGLAGGGPEGQFAR